MVTKEGEEIRMPFVHKKKELGINALSTTNKHMRSITKYSQTLVDEKNRS